MLLVPAVAGLAGFLLATAATTADGTELRNDRRPELKSLIAQRRHEVSQADAKAAQLRGEVAERAAAQAGSGGRVGQEQSRAGQAREPAGLTAVSGPGIVVRLDDAPRRADGNRPAGATVDDLVVHQQDVQSVVNALWVGGADAVMIMNVRVISTSAVRCVGNTLLLDGKVYSPPFAVAAIGDPARLQRSLDVAEGVRLFRAAVVAFGLRYQVKVETDVNIPAFGGSTSLHFARVPE